MKELPYYFSKRPEWLTQRQDVTFQKILLRRTVSYYYVSTSIDARGPLADDQRYVAYVVPADLPD